MKRFRLCFTSLVVLATLVVVLTPVVRAAESDLSVTITPPGAIALGVEFTVDVGYANAGPDTALSAFVNTNFVPPTGLDVVIDDLINGTGEIFAALEASAAGTDTNGNFPLLFWDDFYCETMLFQLQGANTGTATPILPLASGGSGTFSYSATLPVTGANTGTVEITSPPALEDSWNLVDPSNLWVELGLATPYDRYGTTTCEALVGTEICEFIDDNCWGARVSQLDTPIAAQFELVDDGTATPTYGCAPLVGFTPGHIAVVERGDCEFGVKGENAETAGAVAVFLVNDGRCSDFPDSDQCVINMGAGVVGNGVSIPVIMVSAADGGPVISALQGAQTVEGTFGTGSTFGTTGTVFLSDVADVDPNNTNDATATATAVSAAPEIFADDFESGDTSSWSLTSP